MTPEEARVLHHRLPVLAALLNDDVRMNLIPGNIPTVLERLELVRKIEFDPAIWDEVVPPGEILAFASHEKVYISIHPGQHIGDQSASLFRAADIDLIARTINILIRVKSSPTFHFVLTPLHNKEVYNFLKRRATDAEKGVDRLLD